MPKPATPVIVGLERYEVLLGASQPEYIPLPALRSPDGRVMSRWTLTPEEREEVLRGSDVLITIWTFNHPYPPTQVEIANRNETADYHACRLCIEAHFNAKRCAPHEEAA